MNQKKGTGGCIPPTQCTVNPAIVRPAWIQDAAADCLSAIVLVGAWNEGKAGDRACVEAIKGHDDAALWQEDAP